MEGLTEIGPFDHWIWNTQCRLATDLKVKHHQKRTRYFHFNNHQIIQEEYFADHDQETIRPHQKYLSPLNP